MLMKCLADLLSLQMDRWHHDMTWMLFAKLYDALSKICINYVDPTGCHILIHVTFFSKH